MAAATNNLPQHVGATMPNNRAMKKMVHFARKQAGVEVELPPPVHPLGWEVPEYLERLNDAER